MQVFDMRYSRPINNKDTISSLPGNDINAVVEIRCRMVVKFLPRDAMLARYMLSSCFPSVRPSQAGIASKPLDESSWFLSRKIPSTYPTLCCKTSFVSPKIKVPPSGTLPRTPDLENFATASRSRCQQNLSSTVELDDYTYTTVNKLWLSTVTLLLHYFSLLWICCTTCFCS